jgi:hypothetical protein
MDSSGNRDPVSVMRPTDSPAVYRNDRVNTLGIGA